MKKKTTKVTFAVSFTLPEGANLQDAQAYVKQAVQNQRKAVVTDMRKLDPDTVTARLANTISSVTYDAEKTKKPDLHLVKNGD